MARDDCDQQQQPTTTTNNNNNNTAKCVQWARPPSGRLGSSPGFASNMSGVEFKSLKSRSVLSAPAAWFVAAESAVTRHGLAVADASGGSASRLCHPSRRIVRSGGTALRSSPHVFVPSRRALAHLSDQQGSGDCLHVRTTHFLVPVRCCGACRRRCVRSAERRRRRLRRHPDQADRGGFAAAVGDKMIGPILCTARVASDVFAGRGGASSPFRAAGAARWQGSSAIDARRGSPQVLPRTP